MKYSLHILLVISAVVLQTSGLFLKHKEPEVKHTEAQWPGGEWRSVKSEWKARWVREWEEKKIYVPVWKKVWGPVEIREWVPFPRPPPGWGPADSNKDQHHAEEEHHYPSQHPEPQPEPENPFQPTVPDTQYGVPPSNPPQESQEPHPVYLPSNENVNHQQPPTLEPLQQNNHFHISVEQDALSSNLVQQQLPAEPRQEHQNNPNNSNELLPK